MKGQLGKYFWLHHFRANKLKKNTVNPSGSALQVGTGCSILDQILTFFKVKLLRLEKRKRNKSTQPIMVKYNINFISSIIEAYLCHLIITASRLTFTRFQAVLDNPIGCFYALSLCHIHDDSLQPGGGLLSESGGSLFRQAPGKHSGS